jgi:hypothetical protein
MCAQEDQAELSIQNVLEEINKGFKTSTQDDKVRVLRLCACWRPKAGADADANVIAACTRACDVGPQKMTVENVLVS